LPAAVMLVGVLVHGLVKATMHFAVALLVTLQAFGADLHRAFERLLGNGAVAAGTGIGYGLAGAKPVDSCQLHIDPPGDWASVGLCMICVRLLCCDHRSSEEAPKYHSCRPGGFVTCRHDAFIVVPRPYPRRFPERFAAPFLSCRTVAADGVCLVRQRSHRRAGREGGFADPDAERPAVWYCALGTRPSQASPA